VKTLDEILERIEFTDSCWTWTAYRCREGYGRLNWLGNPGKLAHRVVYEECVEPIPAGLELDHTCSVRHCVNPDHLEPVTGVENIRRAVKETCRRGHVRTEANTYWFDIRGYRCRQCLDCRRIMRTR